MDIDWKSIVRTVAPGLATALGGPLAGMAVGALSTAVLGRGDASANEVGEAIAAGSPDILLKMKQAELDFQAKLSDANIRLEEIAAGDRDSARKRQMALADWMPGTLAVLVTLGFFGILAFMSVVDVPPANKDMLDIMLGALGAAWTSIVSYFFGSSAGSLEKTRILGTVVDRN